MTAYKYRFILKIVLGRVEKTKSTWQVKIEHWMYRQIKSVFWQFRSVLHFTCFSNSPAHSTHQNLPSLFLFFFFLSPLNMTSFLDLSVLDPPGLSTSSLSKLHRSEVSDVLLCTSCWSSFCSSMCSIFPGDVFSFWRSGEASLLACIKFIKLLEFIAGEVLSERDWWNEAAVVNIDGLLLLLIQQSDELEVGSNVFSPCLKIDDEFDLGIDECWFIFGDIFDVKVVPNNDLCCFESAHVLSS